VRGRIARQIMQTRLGEVEVDVLGPKRELITVGGPAKASDPSGLGTHLQRLKRAATCGEGSMVRDEPVADIHLILMESLNCNIVSTHPIS